MNSLLLSNYRILSFLPAIMTSQSSMSAIKCFLAFLCILVCVQVSIGYRMKLSRQDSLRTLGGKTESRLNFSSCEQSSNEHTCSLAFDYEMEAAWTQCATTKRPDSANDFSWWRGYLENPSYITSVSIQNADWNKIEEIDGMLEFTMSANGQPCYTHKSPNGQSFGLQSFPCDLLADDLEIRTAMNGAVLGIAEVSVYGVELSIMNVLYNNYLTIKFDDCDQSSTDYSFQCWNAIDNIKSQEATKHRSCSMTQASEQPWWVGYFGKPAIVDHVIVLGPIEEDLRNDLKEFAVSIGNRQCGDAYSSSEPLPVTGKKFTCNEFGSRIKIHIKTGGTRKLTLCEVNVQGFPIELLTSEDRRTSVGCFPSDPRMPVLPDLREPASYTYMNLNKCDKVCRRYKMKYFGVQAGLACWCGNHSPAGSTKAPGGNGTDASNYDMGNCVVPCEGNRSERCGGVTHVHVFELK